MNWIDLLGFFAGCLTTFSAWPQLHHSYKHKDVASLDLKFMLMLVFGLFSWFIYGIAIRSIPIICFNFLGFALWVPIIVMKLQYIKKK